MFVSFERAEGQDGSVRITVPNGRVWCASYIHGYIAGESANLEITVPGGACIYSRTFRPDQATGQRDIYLYRLLPVEVPPADDDTTGYLCLPDLKLPAGSYIEWADDSSSTSPVLEVLIEEGNLCLARPRPATRFRRRASAAAASRDSSSNRVPAGAYPGLTQAGPVTAVGA